MKTGRVRSKETAPAPQSGPAAPRPEGVPPPPGAEPEAVFHATPPSAGSTTGATAAQARNPLLWVFIAIVAVIACIVLLMILRGGGGTEEWVPATQVSGDWTTGVTVFGPQVALEERWQNDCPNSGNTLLQASTCVLRDTSTYRDQAVDDYREAAFNIYYEETWSRVYEARDAEFVTSDLRTDERWEGNRHYTSVEELDKGSCKQTDYTVWADDPNNAAQEVEVYLYECEVWNHVTVTERVYEQAPWCQCQVTTMAAVSRLSDQGSGGAVAWPAAVAPTGGRTEQSFTGRVTFVGGDHRYTVTTQDPNQYQDYLSGQYYIGVKGGRPVAVSDSPPSR